MKKLKTDVSALMLYLFVAIVLIFFFICTVYSFIQYKIALSTPVAQLDCAQVIAKSNPFLRFWGLFYYKNPIFFQDRDDLFNDWININFMVSSNSPYLVGGSSYPPLALLFAKFFVAMGDYTGGTVAARDQTSGIVSILIYYAICVIPTVILIFVACKRTKLKTWTICLLALSLFLTVPFLFVFDRGNYVLLAVPFTFLFVLYYDSDAWWKREISYLSLAVAVGIKLYPAAFAFLLLRKKDVFGFIRTVFYCVLAVLLPFFCFDGGLENIGAFLYWLLDFSGSKGGVASEVVYGISYSYSPYNIVATLAAFFGEGVIDLGIAQTAITAERVGKAITLVCIVCILFTGLFSDKSWKIMLSATLATLFVPSISFVYSAVMMLFPVLFFLLDRDKEKKDWAYFGLFLVALAPVVTFNVVKYQVLGFRWGVSIKHLLEELSYFVLLFLLTADVAVSLIARAKRRKKQS